MVTLTIALEDMKTQLTETVRGALEAGFELIAGVVGKKLAKSMEAAVKHAELVYGAAGGGGNGEIAGLRAQIVDNAIVLLPLMAARDRTRIPTCGTDVQDSDPSANIRIVTTGNLSTGGMRAILIEYASTSGGKPTMRMWSYKHPTVATALEDLLNVTQKHLKQHLGALTNPSSPAMAAGGWITGGGTGSWTRAPTYPSFDTQSTTESNTATMGMPGTGTADKNKLFWDASMVTNPSFHDGGGFNYGSFDTEFDSDEATYVDPAIPACA